METHGLFSIEGFSSQKKSGPGCYGFNITLADCVVDALLKSKRESGEQLTAMLLSNIKQSQSAGFERVRFFEDTWLLLGMSVFGDCACIGVDGNTVASLRNERQSILYSCHNIDSLRQSATILSTWLLWFNTVITLTEYRQPFAI